MKDERRTDFAEKNINWNLLQQFQKMY